MADPFRRITQAQLAELLDRNPSARRVETVVLQNPVLPEGVPETGGELTAYATEDGTILVLAVQDQFAGMAEDDEEFGVPFPMLDALERAAEAAEGIGPSAPQPEPADSMFEAVTTVEISFGPNARSTDVTAFSRGVLTDILKAAGLARATVSSTSRSPADQARVMFANLEKFGVDAQRALYKEPGRKVIEVYRQGKLARRDAATIQAAMRDEIVRLGPTTVSRHASDPKILNVFDVAPSSIASRAAFEAAVRAEPRVTTFLLPPKDPGYHLEIPQPA